MAGNSPTRSWDSVCADCVHCSSGTCSAGHITAGSDDCIAAICEGFLPDKKGDA